MAIGKYLFAAAAGALVPSIVLLRLSTASFERALPADCSHVLDKEFFLQPSRVYPHLECMGELGRHMYLEFYTFDLVLFPLIYSTFLFHALAWLWPQVRLLRILPVVSGSMDICENICMTYILKTFPTRHDALPLVVAIISRIKWGGGLLAALIAIGGLVLRASGSTKAKTT